LKTLMLKCSSCGRYTINEKCPYCGGKVATVHPARYSPDDKYARLRSPLAYKEPGQGTT
jgi:H/ACA ribonucleoprotein complex subunit 3